MPAEKIEKYGLKWRADEWSPLQIEMEMIRKGGRHTKTTGEVVGHGLSFHYEQMRKIIWPELDGEAEGQRWHTLCRDEVLKNKVTVLLGCASSGKTHSAAWIYLCEWLCDPGNTCVLISSTDMRGLRLRVWGEITSLWERAIQRFDYLPGHLIDSRMAITFEHLDKDGDLDDRTIRDMRKGIIGIPTVQGGKFVGIGKFAGVKQKHVRLIADEAQCFPAGSLVDTPSGTTAIEQLQAGDYINNAAGVSRIKCSFKRIAPFLLRIKTQSEREMICTREHPVLTQFGWVKAGQLNAHHYMVSRYEAMQILRGELPSGFTTISLSAMPSECFDGTLQTVWGRVSQSNANQHFGILQSILRREMASDSAGVSGAILHEGTQPQNRQYEKNDVQGASRALRSNASEAGRDNGQIYEFAHAPAKVGAAREDECPDEATWSQAENAWWKRHRTNEGRECAAESISGRHQQLSNQNGHEGREWLSDQLQSRCGISEMEASRRSGWDISQDDGSQGAGRKEGKAIDGAWVDSVEVFQSENFRGFSKCDSGIEVYNLEVENHPSYSVNGFLVHNCMGQSFLSAFANLSKNEDFQAIVLGNPNDFLDPLGKAAEPEDGWDSHMEPEKTSVWKTRFMNGTCVNLIGTDSPNFDFPEDEPTRFKYLISKEKIAETLSFFPKDSFEYYSQCVGAMKIGSLTRRVLTRRMCEDGHALEPHVNWEGPSRTRVYYVDSAYGGDRCVGGWAEFGRSTDGHNVLFLHPPVLVPISVRVEKEAEQQIAEWVKKECEGLNIEPKNMGHDSTGRGSLGTFIARVWSADCQPVESGGAPTSRPVSADTFIWEPDKATGLPVQRLKLCHEHYIKRVTEYWFSFRYAVQASQVRGLTEDTMEEFCQRQWDLFSGKYEVESKIEMKGRIGRSPDLADWAAGILEMARRRGFQISKLANEASVKKNRAWFDDLAREQREMRKERELIPT